MIRISEKAKEYILAKDGAITLWFESHHSAGG